VARISAAGHDDMTIDRRLSRLEQAVGIGNPDCPACRDRRRRSVVVAVEETPDGGTTYPETKPAKCERCGIVPELVIEIVERLVDADEEDRDSSPSRSLGG
jgi:hypothetical protein